MLLSTLSAVLTTPPPISSGAGATLTTAAGTEVTPAVITVSDLWVGGETFEVTSDTDITEPNTTQVTIPRLKKEGMTAAEVAVIIADHYSGQDKLSYTAVGDTVEVLAIEGAVVVTMSGVVVDSSGAVDIPTDPASVTVAVTDSVSGATVVFRRNTLTTNPAMVRRMLAKEGAVHDLEGGDTDQMLTHAIVIRIRELLL